MGERFTNKYDTYKTEKGYRFTFYCDLCSFPVMSGTLINDSFDSALEQAQTYAKRYLNMCHKCGKWICDRHYNENEMQCIECCPVSEERQIHRIVPGSRQ